MGTPWSPKPTDAEKKDPEIYFPGERGEQIPRAKLADGAHGGAEASQDHAQGPQEIWLHQGVPEVQRAEQGSAVREGPCGGMQEET